VLAGLFPVLFIPISVDAYILPRVFLLLAGVAVALILLLTVRRGRAAGSLGALSWPSLAVCAAALAALALSVNFWTSLVGEYLRYESFAVRVAYVLLFCSTVWLLDGPAARRRVVTGFLLGACACALEALWEWYAFRHGLVWGLARPDGNLGNAGLLGAVMAMAVPLALRRSLGGGPLWPAWALALIVLSGGLFVSTSRAGWLAAVLGCAFVVAARTPRRWLPAAGLGALVIGLAAAFLVTGPLGALNADPSAVRVQLWARVLPMLEARPLLGWGEDTFGLVFGAYGKGYLGVIFDRAHSQPLDLIAAQGVAGLVANAWLWVALGLLVVRGGRWKLEERPALLAAILAYWAWASVNFDWVPATAVVWLLAGVLWSPGAAAREPSNAGRAGAGAIAGLAVIAAIFLGALPVLADAAYYRGDARQAVTLDPLQGRYHRTLGEQLVGRGQLAAGAAELRRAGDLGEQDAQVWVELGDAESQLGHAAAARAAYARARAMDPTVITPP
jgi:hypothetical protein